MFLRHLMGVVDTWFTSQFNHCLREKKDTCMYAYTHICILDGGGNPEYAQLRHESVRSRMSFWSPLKLNPQMLKSKASF